MVMAGFNLAPADYRRIRRQRLLAGAAVGALVLLLAAQLAAWAWVRRDAEGVAGRFLRMDRELSQHEAKIRAARAEIPAAVLKKYEVRVTAYNKILEAAAFSWIGLLVELERSVPPHVYLREIAPDLASGQVTLRGNARSFDDLTRLLRGLEQRTAFRDVFLLHQGEKKAQNGGPTTLDFTVTLTYRANEGLKTENRESTK
jgi:Tfp pilus assembly protein PilN